jgi:hemoglobin-like flavoprotein
MVYQCGLRLAARLKSGGPSLGRSPGAHKQRRPVNQDQIQIFGEIGSTQFLEQGASPALFSFAGLLLLQEACVVLPFSKMVRRKSHAHPVHTAAEMTTSTNLIQHSFELAAERCEDLTPLVYGRLFREHPEAEPMFRSEGSELVKGSMLALTIDAILDFAGDRAGSFRMIACEVQSHDAYGTPRKLFGEFFKVIADTMRGILGSDWSPEMEEAWQKLLVEIDLFVAESDTISTSG